MALADENRPEFKSRSAVSQAPPVIASVSKPEMPRLMSTPVIGFARQSPVKHELPPVPAFQSRARVSQPQAILAAPSRPEMPRLMPTGQQARPVMPPTPRETQPVLPIRRPLAVQPAPVLAARPSRVGGAAPSVIAPQVVSVGRQSVAIAPVASGRERRPLRDTQPMMPATGEWKRGRGVTSGDFEPSQSQKLSDAHPLMASANNASRLDSTPPAVGGNNEWRAPLREPVPQIQGGEMAQLATALRAFAAEMRQDKAADRGKPQGLRTSRTYSPFGER